MLEAAAAAPTWMFSSTVRLGKSLRPTGSRAKPRAIRRCGGAPVMSEPPYLMKPAVLDYRAHPLTFRAYARKLDG
jgi:hypothetical protein